MNASQPSTKEHERVPLREAITDAIAYWEPRRLLYNAALAVIVLGSFGASWPASQEAVSLNVVLLLFVLAVMASLCYCAAYIPDVVAQFSGFRPLWLRFRWLLLVLGITFAGIITRFFAAGLFAVENPL